MRRAQLSDAWSERSFSLRSLSMGMDRDNTLLLHRPNPQDGCSQHLALRIKYSKSMAQDSRVISYSNNLKYICLQSLCIHEKILSFTVIGRIVLALLNQSFLNCIFYFFARIMF